MLRCQGREKGFALLPPPVPLLLPSQHRRLLLLYLERGAPRRCLLSKRKSRSEKSSCMEKGRRKGIFSEEGKPPNNPKWQNSFTEKENTGDT